MSTWIRSPDERGIWKRGGKVSAKKLEWAENSFSCDVCQKRDSKNERKGVEACGERSHDVGLETLALRKRPEAKLEMLRFSGGTRRNMIRSKTIGRTVHVRCFGDTCGDVD